MKTADELLPVITQERDQFRAERDQLRAKLAEYEKWSGEASQVYRDCMARWDEDQTLAWGSIYLPALTAAYARGAAEEREACAKIVEQMAVAQGHQECCGCGTGGGVSPPECCADPLYMISDRDAARAIRSRTGGENE